MEAICPSCKENPDFPKHDPDKVDTIAPAKRYLTGKILAGNVLIL